MKQIKLDDFYKHNYLSALTYAPNGKKAAYIVKRIDPKENKYLSDIYLYEKGAHTRLTMEGDVKFFCFADDRTLLFAATRGKQMEEAEKKGSIFTAFFRLDILSKKASKLFQLPIQASSITPIGKDNFLLKATIDLAYPDFYLLDAKEQKKISDKVQADKDYEVLEESPFWFNGRGFVSGKRNAIFIYNAKKNRLSRINDPNIDVNSFAFDAENVYYSGENRTAEAKDKQGVYSYSIANGTTEQILNERYSIYSIHSLGNKLIAIATDKKRFGESENPYFYAIDKKTGDVKVLTAADESLGANVLTDVLLGETRSTKVDGDYLYFVAVDRYHTHLKRIDLDGDIETLIKKDGAIADFDVSKGSVVAMGLFDNYTNSRRMSSFASPTITRPFCKTNTLQNPNIFPYVRSHSISMVGYCFRKIMTPRRNIPRSSISMAAPNAPMAPSISTRCRLGQTMAISSSSATRSEAMDAATCSLTFVSNGVAQTTRTSWISRTPS